VVQWTGGLRNKSKALTSPKRDSEGRDGQNKMDPRHQEGKGDHGERRIESGPEGIVTWSSA